MRRWALVLLAACGGGADTAVRVRVDLESALVVEQLRFTGTSNGATVFGPALRPEIPAGALQSGGELLVLLPDGFDQRELFCGVGAMSGAQMVAFSQSSVRIQRGAEVECRVQLSAPPPAPSCSGCTASDDKCKSGDKDDECGTGGEACMKCEHGTKCKSGRCMQ